MVDQKKTGESENSPLTMDLKFVGGPQDGKTRNVTITGKPLNEHHLLIFPVKDEKGKHISDHIYKYKGDGLFEYQGQTEIRSLPEQELIKKRAVQKAVDHASARLRRR